MNRFVLRMIDREIPVIDGEPGDVRQIIEQEIPATAHAVCLALRSKHFRSLIASSLLARGVVTIETKPARGRK